MPPRRSLVRRKAILDSAEHWFRRRGPRGTSITAICETAGVSRTTLYAHFPSKDDLILAFVKPELRRNQELVRSLLESDEPPLDKLRRVLVSRNTMFERFGPRWLAELKSATGSVGEALDRHHERLAALLDQWFRAERDRGNIRADLSHAQVWWAWQHFAALADDDSLREVMRDAAHRESWLLELFVRAVSSRS